ALQPRRLIHAEQAAHASAVLPNRIAGAGYQQDRQSPGNAAEVLTHSQLRLARQKLGPRLGGQRRPAQGIVPEAVDLCRIPRKPSGRRAVGGELAVVSPHDKSPHPQSRRPTAEGEELKRRDQAKDSFESAGGTV